MWLLILCIIGVIAIALFVLFKWYTKNFDYFKKRGVPYLLPTGYSKMKRGENIFEHLKNFYEYFDGEK